MFVNAQSLHRSSYLDAPPLAGIADARRVSAAREIMHEIKKESESDGAFERDRLRGIHAYLRNGAIGRMVGLQTTIGATLGPQGLVRVL